MCRGKVWRRGASECEAVDEEEAKDDNDACEDAPPQALVHGGLDMLLALHKVLHGQIQRVQGPDVEGSQGG